MYNFAASTTLFPNTYAGFGWFGFNGKENDNEVYDATGTFQDYGMRMYDTRVCRFISVDPLTKKYPWYTPYQFAGNKPIKYIDIDGLEEGEEDLDYEELLRAFDPEEQAKIQAEEALKPPEEYKLPEENAFEEFKTQEKERENEENPLAPETPEEQLLKQILKTTGQFSLQQALNTLTYTSTQTGTTNEVRTTNVAGTEIQINSGHGYNRPHETGNFANLPLTMNQVESEIVRDVMTNVPLSSIPETSSSNFTQPLIRVTTINDIQVGYSVVQTNGIINVGTYYPILK
jgi:RHS repeat-associated protein